MSWFKTTPIILPPHAAHSNPPYATVMVTAMDDVIARFREAMGAEGIVTRAEIVANGELQRFYIDGDKPSSKNGWYVLHGDGVPSGAFGNWKNGSSQPWCAKKRADRTSAELTDQNQRIAEAKRQRDVAREHERARARKGRRKSGRNQNPRRPTTHI